MFCHFIWFLFGFFGDLFAVPSNVERTRIMMQIGQFQDDEEGGGVPKHHTDLERRLATAAFDRSGARDATQEDARCPQPPARRRRREDRRVRGVVRVDTARLLPDGRLVGHGPARVGVRARPLHILRPLRRHLHIRIRAARLEGARRVRHCHRRVHSVVHRRQRVQAREAVGRAPYSSDLGAVAGVLPRSPRTNHAAHRPEQKVRLRMAPARDTHPEPHTRLRRRVGDALPGCRHSSPRRVANVQAAGMSRNLPVDGRRGRGTPDRGTRAQGREERGGVPRGKQGDLRYRSKLK